MPLIGSIPVLRPEAVTRMKDCRRTSTQPGHPFANYSYPPVTVMGRRTLLLPAATAAPKRCRPTRRRHLSPISTADLLSTSTRWIPQLSSVALTLLRLRLPTLALFPHACTGAEPDPSAEAPDSRKRYLRPRVATQMVPRRPAVTVFLCFPLGGRPPPLWRGHNLRRAFSATAQAARTDH